MHDTPDQVHWHEPKAGENAGYGKFNRAPMPYDRFMQAEGVPVYRGIGVRRVQDLPLAPWPRLGGRGSYIALYGTEGLWGLYVVEIPAAGALNVERHLYEKVVLVVEGRGTTEVWQEGQTKRHAFEWQKGSLFSIPLNARPSPGYRRVEPFMAGNRFYLWIGQHETGRYCKAHKHASAAVLICIKGKGYTYTWPEALGTTPWRDGKADKVLRQDYEPVGLVSAAPMSGDWFHQHFGIGKEGLRITAWHGPNNQRSRKPGRPGEQLIDAGAIDIKKGGAAIPYYMEDPNIRVEFAATLAKEGLANRMNAEFYEGPMADGSEPGDVM